MVTFKKGNIKYHYIQKKLENFYYKIYDLYEYEPERKDSEEC